MRLIAGHSALVAVLAIAATAATAHANSPAPQVGTPQPVVPLPVPSPPPSPEPPPPASCSDDDIALRLGALLRGKRYADVHHAAAALEVLCGAYLLERTILLDAIALLRLDDREEALAILAFQERGTYGASARVLRAWAFVSDRDDATSLLAALPPLRASALRALGAIEDRDVFARHASALPQATRDRALALARDYDERRGKSPALAGVLSTLLPGAGQVYAGSWHAAAVTFVLNGLFIGATVELARERHYVTAAAAGAAASFFYVGGIMNAVDLARRRNEQASAGARDELERLLVPELDGRF